MTPEQFAYWLQGFAEISQKAPTEKEWAIVKDHLATVFKKVTPDRTITSPGPGIAAPAYPTWPNPLAPKPYEPFSPNPWNVPGTKPEIICSTIKPNTSYCSSVTYDFDDIIKGKE